MKAGMRTRLDHLNDMDMKNFERFDVVDYLDNEEVIAEYLFAAMEDSDPDMFLRAVADVARARGMSKLAQGSGIATRAFTKHYALDPSPATKQ